jgi:hypothetical protein
MGRLGFKNIGRFDKKGLILGFFECGLLTTIEGLI